jgi:hypothetical protein
MQVIQGDETIHVQQVFVVHLVEHGITIHVISIALVAPVIFGLVVIVIVRATPLNDPQSSIHDPPIILDAIYCPAHTSFRGKTKQELVLDLLNCGQFDPP